MRVVRQGLPGAERFSPREKEIYEARVVQGKSWKEIASALGISNKTVQAHYYRALSKFRADEKKAKGLDARPEQSDD